MDVCDFINRNGKVFWSSNYDPGGYKTNPSRINPFRGKVKRSSKRPLSQVFLKPNGLEEGKMIGTTN